MLDSASVNSISSIPSPVYQCKKAFLLNIAVNYSATRLNISWIAVELPMKVTCHLQALWWDIANAWFNVVGNPLNEVWAVLVLHVQHLLIHFLGGHSASEEGRGSQVASMSWIGCAHHVLCVEHLLRQFRHSQCSVLLRSSGGQWGKANHKEMQSGEGNQVHCELSQVRVQLTWESQTAGNATHCSGDQMVQITVSGGGQFKGSEANIVKCLVIDDHAFICVFDQLMDWKSGIVGLNDSVRHLGGRHNWEGFHDSIRVLFSDLADKKCSHSWSSASSERVSDLESL